LLITFGKTIKEAIGQQGRVLHII